MTDEEYTEYIFNLMKEGDPRAPIALGSRVEKINGEPGDLHELGHQGTVKGSLVKEIDGEDICMYLVHFDGDGDRYTLTIKVKLKET